MRATHFQQIHFSVIFLHARMKYILQLLIYSLTWLCQSGRDPEKYFDIGMIRDNELGNMGSETFWQNISYLFRSLENIK